MPLCVYYAPLFMTICCYDIRCCFGAPQHLGLRAQSHMTKLYMFPLVSFSLSYIKTVPARSPNSIRVIYEIGSTFSCSNRDKIGEKTASKSRWKKIAAIKQCGLTRCLCVHIWSVHRVQSTKPFAVLHFFSVSWCLRLLVDIIIVIAHLT